MVWSIDLIDDSNRNGSMEIVAPGNDPDAFFPVEVTFTSTSTVCSLDVVGLTDVRSNDSVEYAMAKGMKVESYTVGP